MLTIQLTDRYWSELYDNGHDFSLITSEALTKTLAYTDSTLPKTSLDIGCGTGQLTRELYHRGYTCTGIDVSTSAIKIAQSLTTVPTSKLHYMHFDIDHDNTGDLPEQQYSLITCKLAYAFIKDKPAFLARVKQLLNPGGIFVVITPHINNTPAERRGIAVDDNEIKLLSSHFTQIALYEGNEPVGPLTYFVGR